MIECRLETAIRNPGQPSQNNRLKKTDMNPVIPKTTNSVTFSVSEVIPATTHLDEVSCMEAINFEAVQVINDKANFRAILADPTLPNLEKQNLVRWRAPKGPQRKLEACSTGAETLIKSKGNPFFMAVNLAYAQHRPLAISPDMIWLLIVQGFARHVNENAEELRHYFVDFQGKMVVSIYRNDFVKGSPDNDWESAFPQICEGVGRFTGKALLNLIVNQFSTTGNAEKAAFEISLLDAMQAYLHFTVNSCGIPEITLEGTTDDWELIRAKAQALSKYRLDWWIDELLPVLDEFVQASSGIVNRAFWQDILVEKKERICGGLTYVTGWIHKLFPYLVEGKNPMLDQDALSLSNERERRGRFIRANHFSSGLSKAPFTWKTGYEGHKMEFIAGFTGIRQCRQTMKLRPEIGWAVIDTGETLSGAEKETLEKDFEKTRQYYAAKLLRQQAIEA